MKIRTTLMGPLSSNQILEKGLKFPHFPTLSEPRGTPCPTKMTRIWPYENQNHLYGPFSHKSDSSEGPKNPHSSTLSELRGSPCPTLLTIFKKKLNQNHLNGPISHKSDSSEGPQNSTFHHPLGTERVSLSYYDDHILNISKWILPIWAHYGPIRF